MIQDTIAVSGVGSDNNLVKYGPIKGPVFLRRFAMKRINGLIFTLLAAMASPVLLFAYWPGRGRYGCYQGIPFFSGGTFMFISTIVITGLVIFFAVYFIKNKDNFVSKNETSLDILKNRYARGEITVDEFKKMRTELSN